MTPLTSVYLRRLIYLLFVGYRVGGTVGAVVTCPLEVIKTRLQSSSSECSHSAIRGLRAASTGAATTTAGSSANHMYFTPEMNWNMYYHHHQCPVNSRLVVFHESVLPWTTSTSSSSTSSVINHPKGTLSCFR